MEKRGILLLVLLFLPTIVSAADYYADVSINVDKEGFVTIDGTTNHPTLLVQNSQEYTSKKQAYWILNITTKEDFSDFVYSLDLPSGASINYIKSSGSFRIEGSLGKLSIKGFGQDKPFSVVVQYNIQKEPVFSLLSFIVFIAIITLAGFIVSFIITKFSKINKIMKKDVVEESEGFDLKGLSRRQKSIIEMLLKNNKPITQATLQKELKLPKASLSRNIQSLELKGFIEKEQAGMSNLIRLKKK
jgi:uncharacterized membrane protein